MGRLKRALAGLSRVLRRGTGPSAYAKARYQRIAWENKRRLGFHQEKAKLASLKGKQRRAKRHRRDYKRTLRAKRILMTMGGPRLVNFLRREGLTPAQIDSFPNAIASTRGAVIREGDQLSVNLNKVLAKLEAGRRNYLKRVHHLEQPGLREKTAEQLLAVATERAGGASAEDIMKRFTTYDEEALASYDALIRATRALIKAGR